MIKKQKIICLDSSNLINLLDLDKSNNKDANKKYEDFKLTLEKENIKILISSNHLIELLGSDYENDRLTKLSSIPQAIYISLKTRSKNKFFNYSVGAILTLEIMAIIKGFQTTKSIQKYVKKILIKNNTTYTLDPIYQRKDIKNAIKEYKRLLNFAASTGDGQKEKNEKIKDILRLENSKLYIEQKKTKMIAEALKQKLIDEDYAQLATDKFFEFLSKEIIEKIDPERPIINQIMNQLHIKENEYNEKSYIIDLICLSVTRSQIKNIYKTIQMPLNKNTKINEEIIPSYQVIKSIIKYKQERENKTGSDLTDLSLLLLSPYCDIMSVDRRTFQDIEQAKRSNPELKNIMCKIIKQHQFNKEYGII